MKFFKTFFLIYGLAGFLFSYELKVLNNQTLIPGEKTRIKLLEHDENGITLEIKLGKLEVGNIAVNKEVFQRLNLKNSGVTVTPGLPELPVILEKIAIPIGAEPEVKVVSMETKKFEDMLLFPAQRPLPESKNEKDEDFSWNQEFYKRNVKWPGYIVKLSKPHSIRDVEFISLYVFPVQYNPGKKEAEVVTSLKLRINFVGGTGKFRKENRLWSPYFEPLFANLFLNYRDIEEFKHRDYKELNFSLNVKKGLLNPENAADLLIITPDVFYDSILPYALWRQRNGILTKVVKLSEIGNGPQEIRNFIKNAYNSWQIPPSFVMLVGDAEFIPPFYLFHHPYTNELIGTDVYYGEMDEDVLPFPDIFVGRISVDNLHQLSIYWHKVYDYEKNPPHGPWFNRVLLAAYNESGRYFIATSESVYVYLSSQGYICNRQYEDGNPPGSTQGVLNAINTGVFLVNHRDHGSSRNGGGSFDGWGHPQFTTQHVPLLENGNRTPVFFSPNCESGWFDGETDEYTSISYESLGEELIRAQNKGALAYIGATRVSYSGYNDELDKGFFDAIWPDFDYNYPGSGSVNPLTGGLFYLGGILNYGKFWMYDKYVATNGSGYPWQPEPEETRTELEEFNLVGDPSFMITTHDPQELVVQYPQTVPFGQSQITVSVTSPLGFPVQGARVTITQNDTSIFVSDFTDNQGIVHLNLYVTTPDSLLLSVFAHNYLPFSAKIQPVSQGPYVSYLHHQFDDDSLGQSSGNGNGRINPGETIELSISFRNWGSQIAQNVHALLRAPDSLCQIIDSTATLGNLAPGDSAVAQNLVLRINQNIKRTTPLPFTLITYSSEGDTWTSYFSETIKTAYIKFLSFTVDDSDGVLDPGDTAGVFVKVLNKGPENAENAVFSLISEDNLLEVIDPFDSIDFIGIHDTATVYFVLYANPQTPRHYPAKLVLLSSERFFSGTDTFEITIGKGGDFLVWDPDPNHSSGPIIKTLLDSLGLKGEYTTDLLQYESEIPYYRSIFVTVGMYSDNYHIGESSQEAQLLQNYLLEHNGNLYLEGGDVWYYDPQSAGGFDFGPLFGIDGVEDGGDDLDYVLGITGTFLEGMNMHYNGENSWVDHLVPVGSGFAIMQNSSPMYYCGVANEVENGNVHYRTVGLSFELGGLQDSPEFSKFELVRRIAQFFDVVQYIEENNLTGLKPAFSVRFKGSNVVKDKLVVEYSLPKKTAFEISIYDVAGRRLKVLEKGVKGPGKYTLTWKGLLNSGKNLSAGLYFLMFKAGNRRTVKRFLKF